eukprot:4213501-Ditylum_brightwellii.AAC.1
MALVSAALRAGNSHEVNPCYMELCETATNASESSIAITCSVVVDFLRCLVCGSTLYCSQNVGTVSHVADCVRRRICAQTKGHHWSRSAVGVACAIWPVVVGVCRVEEGTWRYARAGHITCCNKFQKLLKVWKLVDDAKIVSLIV